MSYLWDDARGAMFDRDKNHNQMPTLIHNTLRCMYWHSLPDALAERFVKEHLLNPQEFWTKMPLPSVAANDPLFRNVTTNNWSGQAEALTYQRAMRAAGFSGIGIESRNAWYRDMARKELMALKGEIFDEAARRFGKAFIDKNIDIWTKMIGVLDTGEHAPHHLRGQRPGT